MVNIITYGTFDLIHNGHINLLRRAKEYGDHLTVALSSDTFNKIKDKDSYYKYEIRKMILESIRYVDNVIQEDNWEQKIQDIIDHNIDIFIMGDDWEGKFDYLNEYCKVIYLPRTVGISSTQIKSDFSKANDG
ncbi:glycerol-3-phosphate cytidylyltransferase [Aquibacillus halophilus]|uniref:Glycerol-3-phosphate cytidylyltransferase n=1 Tax=Aquibacillus halophilus TaxID=930132 RepID=A0A6A8D691_9BACI|nr:glycerol-3-phosphate cytidylyltransferase [Aquibacillus halophilus]MRH41295.1 glycerol-3-phosphate cytidylyltransferase [Aquibacillus halophilus]